MEFATQELLQALKVQLDHVVLGRDFSIGLGDDQNWSSGNLLGLYVGGLGLGATLVERVLGNIAYFLPFIFDGTNAVHEVFIHFCVVFSV